MAKENMTIDKHAIQEWIILISLCGWISFFFMCSPFLLSSFKRLASCNMILGSSVPLASFNLSLSSSVVCIVFFFLSSYFAHFSCFPKSIFPLSMLILSFTLSRSNNIISLWTSKKILYLAPFAPLGRKKCPSRTFWLSHRHTWPSPSSTCFPPPANSSLAWFLFRPLLHFADHR